MVAMAMFPLGSVLFPGMVLPLHVFEPRYRQLVQDCLAEENAEFGVTLIDRGSEVGGGDIRSMVGTVARIVQVAELDDGRYAVVTAGTRRIRVDYWLPDDPYPMAEVTDWPDDEGELDAQARELLTTAAARVRRVNALATELGGSGADATTEISDDPTVGSYHLCALAPLGPADQQRLLSAGGAMQRLQLLGEALDDVEALLQFQLQYETGGEMPPDLDNP